MFVTDVLVFGLLDELVLPQNTNMFQTLAAGSMDINHNWYMDVSI